MSLPPEMPKTRYTLLLAARMGTAKRHELIERYRLPLGVYFRAKARGPAYRRDECDDALHDFIEHFFLGVEPRYSLYMATDRTMPFRAYLLSAANNFLAEQARKATSQKRTPAGGVQALDAIANYDNLLLDSSRTPEQKFFLACDLECLARCAREAVRLLISTKHRPLDLALMNLIQGGSSMWKPLPDMIVRELGNRHGSTPSVIRDRWDTLRANHILVPYLTLGAPAYAELEAKSGLTSMRGRLASLRRELAASLEVALREELDVIDPEAASKEAARRLDEVMALWNEMSPNAVA